MAEQKHYHFSKTGVFYAMNNLDDALSAMSEGGYIWLDYYDPGKEELMVLADRLGIHPLSVEDCLDNNQVPKIEHFPDNTFIIFNAFHYTDKTFFIDEINFFIGKNYLITVSGHNSEGRKPFSEIGKIISNDTGNTNLEPSQLLHRILDYVVDQKVSSLEAVEDELEISEDQILDAPASFDPVDLMRIRKSLQLLRKSLFHEREILLKICRLDCQFIKDKVIVHYRDIYDHLAKFFGLAETYREVVTSLMELYSSLQNNLMNRSANETNSSVRRLTLITTVFMPLTLIASIGGMSEWSMITGPSNYRISYPLLILAMVIIAAVNLMVIRRIERRGRFPK